MRGRASRHCVPSRLYLALRLQDGQRQIRRCSENKLQHDSHDNGLSGSTLTVPYRYKLSQSLRSPGATVEPSLVKQIPITDRATEINISDKNRGSGQCMQMLPSGLSPGGHQVITARCTLNNDQHWEWRADRIYSLYNGAADDWRLHVNPGGLVDVRTEDKDKYQDLPKNPFQDLLIPWSNYPSQPVLGVFVPVLMGNQPPIPEDWLRFRAVGPDQTWKITVLRQSLMP